MTTIGMNLGGAGGTGAAPGSQQRVDWADPKYATPHAVPGKRKFGMYREPILDIPQLPERNIRVRARPPATYYTDEGSPIPADQWVTVPISPGLIAAIKSGDLERGPDPVDEPAHQQRQQQQPRHSARQHATHTTEARPPETPAT